MKTIKNILLYGLALLGGVVLISIVTTTAALIAFSPQHAASIPKQAVLHLDLSRGILDADQASLPSQLLNSGGVALGDIHLALKKAATDPKIKGFSIKLGGLPLGLAQVQELRGAVDRFKTSGKPTFAFIEDISGPGATASYYLASSFDQVWLQPSGGLGLTGFAIETPFIKGALEKLAVQPIMSKRYEYKSAVETFTEEGFSDPTRANLTTLLDSFLDQVIKGVSRSRNLPTPTVETLIDTGPFLANEALDAGLVDHLGYADQWQTAIEDKTDGAKSVKLSNYANTVRTGSGKGIAVIYASGTVQRGQSQDAMPGRPAVLGSDTVIQALKDAADDPDVAAIVLRINSPGGGYVAADSIWRQVMVTKESKPVIASMGDMAASGGYFIAMAADSVVAQPGTITGSIGVFSGKFILKGLFEKLGVKWEQISAGKNAGMWSFTKDFTPEQAARFEHFLDAIYADFSGKAAQNRTMTLDEIDKVARGRVFSGLDAQRLRLVDRLGGLDEALALAKEKAGIKGTEHPRLIAYPKERPLWEALQTFMGGGAPGLSVSNLPAPLLEIMAPLVQKLDLGDPRKNTLRFPYLSVQ